MIGAMLLAAFALACMVYLDEVLADNHIDALPQEDRTDRDHHLHSFVGWADDECVHCTCYAIYEEPCCYCQRQTVDGNTPNRCLRLL